MSSPQQIGEAGGLPSVEWRFGVGPEQSSSLFTESEMPPTPCPSQPDQLTQLPRMSILSGWNRESDLAH